MPEDGRTAEPDAARPALTLLREADAVFTALEACTLGPADSVVPRASWDDLVMARAVAEAQEESRPLQVATARALRAESADDRAGSPAGSVADDALPSLEDVLDAVDRGLLWMEIADRIPKPQQASWLTGASARNFVRPSVFNGLAGLVHLRLVQAGQVTPDLAWSGHSPGLTLPGEWARHMDEALDAAVADTPDTALLRSLLAGVAFEVAR